MWAVLFFFVVLVSLCPGGFSAVQADATIPQFNAFWRQDSVAAFSQWSLNGVVLNQQSTSLQLAPGKKALICSRTDIDGGATSYNVSAGLCTGRDPLAAGSYDKGLNYYNGGSFYFGTAVSPSITLAHPINSVVVSWNATTPPGTWMEVHIRTLQGSTW